MRTSTTSRVSWRSESGQVAWALALIVLVAALSTAAIAASYSSITRSSEQTNHIATTQRTEAAVADAIATLSAGNKVPATRAAAQAPDCQVISGRDLCYQYWALPVPGNAADPLRYDVISHAWVDKNQDGQPPADGRGVRAVLTPVEAITYQTGAGVGPVSANGKISYTATPHAPLSKPLYSFRSTTINGPGVTVASYDSSSGENGTEHGQVTSSGWVSYGRDISVDSTMMYGYEGSGGTRISRCTGEPCTESEVRVLTHSYAPATQASTGWMDEADCASTWTGDWVASEHEGRIDADSLCIEGALIIDTPTQTTKPESTIQVRGAIVVNDSLNAPGSTQVARPGKLAIYSSGSSVTFDSGGSDLAVSALLWAPLATCSTDPAQEGQTTFYGSLACDVISLGGSWRHRFDDAALTDYDDPVPGAAKAWIVGSPQDINAGGTWDVAPGWTDPACVLPPPAGATTYWKLNEPTGMLAADSAGNVDAAWASASQGRVDGLCGTSAESSSSGQVRSAEVLRSATGNLTLEWWGKGNLGSIIHVAGVQVSATSTDHIALTAGGSSATLPFTVQNLDSWHLYTLSIAGDGTVRLYVDGGHKASGSVSAATTGSTTTLAGGASGAVSDVVFYSRVLTQSEITDRWLTWVDNADFTATDPGTPFKAPANVRDAGTTPTQLSLAWDTAAGTFPHPDAYYEVQRKDGGSWETISEHLTDTRFDLDDPDQGIFDYRVCATYNGDTRCSTPVEIITLAPPEAPVVTASDITDSSITWSWTNPGQAIEFHSYYVLPDGSKRIRAHTSHQTWTQTGLPAGAEVKLRVKAWNGAEWSPWSDFVTVFTAPATPSLALSTQTGTSIRFAWDRAAGAEFYEVRYSHNGGSWKTDVVATALSWTADSLEQGDLVKAQVRGVGVDGARSAWSNAVSTNTPMQAPNVEGWEVSYDWPYMYATLTSDGANFCAAGGELQTRVRDNAKRNGTWSGWSSWSSWHTTSRSSGQRARSTNVNYDVQVRQDHQVRCRNAASGAVSTSSTHRTDYLQHVPKPPTGVFAGAGGKDHQREAYWGATCINQTVPRYSVTVTAHWGKWSNGSVSYETYAVDKGWGAWKVHVTAWCGADNERSTTVTTNASGG